MASPVSAAIGPSMLLLNAQCLLCSDRNPGMPLLVCSGALVALDVAQALAFLHDGLGVVHFDVKPAVRLRFFLTLVVFLLSLGL